MVDRIFKNHLEMSEDLHYTKAMPVQARLPRFVLFLALSFFLLGISHVITHLSGPYDGARLEPGKQAWLPEGVLVNPFVDRVDGLRANDLVLAVNGVPITEFADSLIKFEPLTSLSDLKQPVTYLLLRDGEKIELPVVQAAYPNGALLRRNWAIYVVVLALQAIMTFVLVRRPSEPAAHVLFIFAWSLWHFPTWTMGLQVSDIVNGWGYWQYRLVTATLFLLTFSSLLHLSLIFPKRHPILNRFPRLVPSLYLAAYLLFGLFMAAARMVSPNSWIWLGYWNSGEWAVTAIYMFIFILVTIQNYRHITDAETRAKIRWIAFGWCLAGAGIVFLWLIPGALLGQPIIPANAIALLALPVPIAMAIAILRYRLFNIDIVINRALVYGTLTTIIVSVYVFIVGYVGTLFHTQTSDHSKKDIILSLIAAGLVAVIFQPLRERLQRAVNRFLYGERDDPYSVLSQLGEHLEAAANIEATLPAIVETIAQALKLPYVAIIFTDGEEDLIAASSGARPGYMRESIPLIYQSVPFGKLELAPRAESEPFSQTEKRLLTDLARQVEVAAHNVRLTDDLRRSRQRIVSAREEERRRLRRDLHDGLGPQLASQTLMVDAISKLLERDPATARQLLGNLKSGSQAAIKEIRRLIYNLRPPALDDLGLVRALRESSVNQASGLQINIEATDDFTTLAAAVEVAAYRIVQEAIANVIHHAQARSCHVGLKRIDSTLDILVEDDGIGLGKDLQRGVGLVSMRERAEELGGRFELSSERSKGTRVHIILPTLLEDK